MQFSDHGRAVLVQLEGSSPLPYKDVAGMWTIGIGHMLTKSELLSGKLFLASGRTMQWKTGPLTQTDIDTVLVNDLMPVERSIRQLVKRPLTQGQYDALCCFIFNIGPGAFAGSTLLKKLNMGDYASVPSEMRRWVHAGGQVMKGLKQRRKEEVALWGGQV